MDRSARTKGFLMAMVMALALGIFLTGVGRVHAQVSVTLPSVPTSLSASFGAPSSISVSWAASTESSGTIEGYYVYRNGVQITTTNITSFSDNDLTPGVYAYTIVAFDGDGNVSAQSSPVSASVLPKSTTPPTTPTGVTVSGPTSTDSAYVQIPVTISWNASTDSAGIAGYNLYRNGILLTTSTAAYTSTSYGDMITPGVTYWYAVVTYDVDGNISNQSAQASFTISIDTTPPSTPTNLTAQQVSAGGVNLLWATSTDNVGIAGYQIFRNGTQIASAGGPPYSDTGLTAGNAYIYTIAAYDNAGNISFTSAPATVLIQTATGPGTPYGLSAIAIGTSSVRFSWAPVGDALALTGYTVYRDGLQIASIAPTSTAYLDEGIASGTYYYGVTASDVSGAVSAMTTSTLVTVPAQGALAISNILPPIVAPPTTATPSVVSSVAATPALATFTQFLYFGLRVAQVETLQSLLAKNGYLAAANATGYFGDLTLHAIEKFQCDENIVCTGGAGWGTVGPKTRAALNELEGETTTTSTLISTSALAGELQTLEAELAALESKAH